MGQNDPLSAALPIVSGYNQIFPLLEDELEYLYAAIAMRLVISVTKSAINKKKEPGNAYLQISEKPAWDLLEKWRQVSSDLAHYRFREACGLRPHPGEERFRAWAKSRRFSLQDLFPTVNRKDCATIDLSVSSSWLGHHEEFSDFDLFQFRLDQMQKKHPDQILAGGYLEPRMVYTTSAYDRPGNSGKESRTIHLGVDFWLPAGTPVHAILDGEVAFAVNDAGDKEYGGLVVLKHQEEGICFYSLYGHLSVASALERKPG